jgi:hypothetical protein
MTETRGAPQPRRCKARSISALTSYRLIALSRSICVASGIQSFGELGMSKADVLGKESRMGLCADNAPETTPRLVGPMCVTTSPAASLIWPKQNEYDHAYPSV